MNELQEILFNNYGKLIDTSKNISTFLDSDIAELSNLVNEMKDSIKGIEKSMNMNINIERIKRIPAVSEEQMKINQLNDRINEFHCSIIERKFPLSVKLCHEIETELNQMENEQQLKTIDNLRKVFYERRNELKGLLTKQMYLNYSCKISETISLLSQLESHEIVSINSVCCRPLY